MLQLPDSPVILVPLATALVAILLFFREYSKRLKFMHDAEKVSRETREKGLQLYLAAEAAQTQILADGKYSTSKAEEEFKHKISDLIEHSQVAITTAQSQLLQFMVDLQKRSEEFEQVSKQSAQQRINQLFDHLESRLTDFLITTEQKTTSSIELELKAARSLIDTYKAQQLKLIDENIIAMMEQTLNIVLAKKLSLKDQMDLVFEALEKAKVEKFIV